MDTAPVAVTVTLHGTSAMVECSVCGPVGLMIADARTAATQHLVEEHKSETVTEVEK